MNRLQWEHQGLTFRTLFYSCFANWNGETFSAQIEQIKIFKWNREHDGIRVILSDGQVLEVDLTNLDFVTPDLYYFETDDGRSCMLVIPAIQEESNDD